MFGLSCAEWHIPKAGIQDHSLHGGFSRSLSKPLRCSGTKEGRPDLWAWLIPVLNSEERAGSFTSAGLEYLYSSEEDIFSWDYPPETSGKEAMLGHSAYHG